jgi:hypothetical protein
MCSGSEDLFYYHPSEIGSDIELIPVISTHTKAITLSYSKQID